MITSSDGLLGRVESHEQLGVVCGAVQEGAKTANSCLVAGGGQGGVQPSSAAPV